MHGNLIHHRLKARREMLQLTQEALAGISGVSLRTLKQIESGKGNPTLFTIQQLAEVLGLELNIRVKQLSSS